MTEVKRGDKITVILGGPRATAANTKGGTITLVLLLDGRPGTTWNAREYRRRERNRDRRQSTYPVKQRWTVDISPDREGVTWAKGWDSPDALALRAQHALERNR